MDAVPLGGRVQRMKVEPRQIQSLKAGGAEMRVKASDAAGVQVVRNVATSAFFEKLLQALMPEADDHSSMCTMRRDILSSEVLLVTRATSACRESASACLV